MFKCKQCGRGFSANTPDKCPDCGAANRQPDDMTGGRFMSLVGMLTLGFAAELLILGIIIGIVVALLIKFVL